MAPFFIRSHVYCNYRLNANRNNNNKSSAKRNLLRTHLFFILIRLTSPTLILNDFSFRSRLFVAAVSPFLIFFFCFSLFRRWENVNLSKRDHMTNDRDVPFDISLCRQHNLEIDAFEMLSLIHPSNMLLLRRLIPLKVNRLPGVRCFASDVRSISDDLENRGLLKQVFPNKSR